MTSWLLTSCHCCRSIIRAHLDTAAPLFHIRDLFNQMHNQGLFASSDTLFLALQRMYDEVNTLYLPSEFILPLLLSLECKPLCCYISTQAVGLVICESFLCKFAPLPACCLRGSRYSPHDNSHAWCSSAEDPPSLVPDSDYCAVCRRLITKPYISPQLLHAQALSPRSRPSAC